MGSLKTSDYNHNTSHNFKLHLHFNNKCIEINKILVLLLDFLQIQVMDKMNQDKSERCLPHGLEL